MGRRWFCLLALCAVALLCPAVASARVTCATPGETLKAAGGVRVFSAPKRGKPRRVYACFAGHRAYLLGVLHTRHASGRTAYIVDERDLAISGQQIAYRTWYFPADRESANRLVVRDLQTGRVRVSVGGYPSEPAAGDLIYSFAVASTGAAAWIDVSSAQGGQAVHAADAGGTRVLDRSSASEIGVFSLALSQDQTTVYWLHGADERSASLH